MININFKKIIWKIFIVFWNIFAFIGFGVTAYFLYLVFDDAGYCISEEHGVWDEEQKICRHDCAKWDKEHGCITSDMLKDNKI